MNKKAIIILGVIFLLILGTLGFLVYSRYASDGESQPLPTDTTSSGTVGDLGTGGGDTLPVDSGGEDSLPVQPPVEKFIKLFEEQVVSPILFYNGNGVTYLNSRGELYKSDFEADASGKITLTRTRNLDIPAKANISRISWPRNGDDFIAEFEDFSGNRSYSYFNFSTGAYVDLPNQVNALEWMPAGDKILFVWVDVTADGKEKATLNIANPDTTGYQEIAELYESDNLLYLSPDGLNVAFHRAQNTASTNKIVQTTPDGKIWKDLVKEGYNYGVLWSPDSQKFLFGKRSRGGQAYELWYYDLYTGEVRNLGVLSLPQKAVWASDSRTVFVAASKNEQGISDPNDLKNTFTSDTFYKIFVDVSSLDKTEYLPENLTLDGRDLFLNPAEDKLFFKNAQDGALYYLDLTR